MSSDLIWLLTRDQSSFLVKRNGIQLTREPGNLLNKNSLKYSGLAQRKTIDIQFAEKGAHITLKKTSVPAHKHAKLGHKTTIQKGVRASSKSVTNLLSTYRPDLQKAALARLTRVTEAQQKPKAQKPKKLRGVRARKATVA
ncbi:ribosomal L28e/Mak16 [Fimicolochytrium jonesii]|uniref:ribosomal L28e/Mak16 n=1 Tax=Fimicolochytrium jonesii TaxID=1396493 RepID=UPI0022FEBD2C|nr:ribosomal L28e/Mak16 [Fimicolochytrium jonesii]KAI8824473.1 ribosomal L28e/Mak16 [Fimicolochytrium jonesii]